MAFGLSLIYFENFDLTRRHVQDKALQDIPEPASWPEAPVHSLDSEKLRPVCHPAAMMPGHAGEGRAILFGFHVPAYGPKRARVQPSN